MSATSIFGKLATTEAPVAMYRAELQFTGYVSGGVPDIEAAVRSWVMANMPNSDEREVTELVHETLQERSLNPDLSSSLPTIKEEAEAVANKSDRYSVNGFKRHPDTGELSLEGRCLKAAFKEWVNVSYPDPTSWPGMKTRALKNGRIVAEGGKQKSMLSVVAEKLTVPERFIGLGVKEPTEVVTRVKHFEGKYGEHQSAFNRAEVVLQPQISFEVHVVDDFIPEKAWARIWVIGEGIGIGSDRHRSDGMFDLISWTRVS